MSPFGAGRRLREAKSAQNIDLENGMSLALIPVMASVALGMKSGGSS